MAIVWLIMKVSVSFFSRRPEEFTLVRLVSLGCYLITVNITGATFLFHFVFFAASSLNRLGNFIENFELALASHRLDDNSIKALDVFVLSYSTFETLIERINSIFCLQVIEQFITPMEPSHPPRRCSFYLASRSDNFHAFCYALVQCFAHLLARVR